MTLPRRISLFTALSAAAFGLALWPGQAHANSSSYHFDGTVYFTNVSAGTQIGALVPYSGYGYSPQLGPTIQTGSIRNLSGLIPVNATTFRFYGEVGPNPDMPNHPRVHLMITRNGNIFCKWTAVFTLRIINGNGDAILSGDGDFIVNGGTERYKKATGRFRTLFQTSPVPAGSNDASAWVVQDGTIRK